MSLLNEMLKDLEKSASKTSKTKPVFSEVKQRMFSRQLYAYLRYILLSVVLANAVIIIYLWMHKPAHKVASNLYQIPKPIALKMKQEKQKLKEQPKVQLSKVLDKKRQVPVEKTPKLKDFSLIRKQESVVEAQSKPIKVVSALSKREMSRNQYTKALRFFDSGKIEEGEVILQTIIANDPSFYKAWQSLIISMIENEQYVLALKQVALASKLFPAAVEINEYHATILMKLGRIPESIKVLNASRPDFEHHPNYYALLAALYEKVGQAQKSGEIYQQLVKVFPENTKFWLGFALALEQTNHVNQALSAYQKVTENYQSEPALTAFAQQRIDKIRG